MKVTVLVENSLYENAQWKDQLKAIHGLSLFIETGNRKILFDTGMDSTLLSNAGAMDVDLSQVDMVIISHGHLDHGGGLKHFSKVNDTAPVYMHRKAVDPHYSKRLAGLPIPIGLKLSDIEKFGDRKTYIDESEEIAPGIRLYENISGEFPQPVTNGNLCRKDGKNIVPDNFRHEVVLSIEEDGRLFIFTGCSHSGIVNMVNLVKKENPGKDIASVWGGFHTFSPGKKTGVPDDYLSELINELEALNTTFYTGHCTGDIIFKKISQSLGDRLKAMNTGLVAEL